MSPYKAAVGMVCEIFSWKNLKLDTSWQNWIFLLFFNVQNSLWFFWSCPFHQLSLGIGKSSQRSFNIRMLMISCHEPYTSLSFWFEKKLKLTWKKNSDFSTFQFLFNDTWIMKYTWIKRDDVTKNIFFQKYLWCKIQLHAIRKIKI